MTLLLLVAAALAPGESVAHPVLIRSDPPANAALAEPPREVRLTFSERVSSELTTAKVTSLDGRALTRIRTRVDPARRNVLVLELPRLRRDLYAVRWSLASGDGHVTRGLLVFGVGTSVPPGAAVDGAAEPAPALLEVVIRWIDVALLCFLIGVVAVLHLVLGPMAREGKRRKGLQRVRSRLLAWGALCACLGAATGVVLLAWQVAQLSSTAQGRSTSGSAAQLVFGTRWGLFWLAEELLLIVALDVLRRRWRAARTGTLSAGESNAAPVAPLVVGASYAHVVGGHASSVPDNELLTVVVALLHVLAAGVWLGGLVALVIGLWPLYGPRRHNRFAVDLGVACWRRFGPVAAASLGVLIASGLYSAGRQVASVDALLTTLYGRALLIKLGLVVATVALGLCSATLLRQGRPRRLAGLLARPRAGAASLVPRFVVVEASFALCLLAVVGLLVTAPPARGPQFAPPGPAPPSTLTASADDLLVTLSVTPNRPGKNLFEVLAASTRRPPPAAIGPVRLRITRTSKALGTVWSRSREVEPGRYRSTGAALGLPGRWRIDVVVERPGQRATVAHLDWSVAEPLGRAPMVSARPLGPALIRAAAAAMLLLVLAAVWLAWRSSARRTLRLGGLAAEGRWDSQAS